MRPTFAITTLGCKVNQYEGQAIRERMATLGWREVRFSEPADVYIVNTCTVTSTADEKCRKRVRRARRTNACARVIVTGCAATTSPEQFRQIDGVSAVLTRDRMVHIADFIRNGCEPEPGDVFDLEIGSFGEHTRAFLKIQDGCDAGCTYCIVPRARGPARSRAVGAIRREAARLVASGHREIVLTGTHLGRYGHDLEGRIGLADVMRTVLRVGRLERLRLSSIEALELGVDLIEIAAADSRVCPHFHVPLQSGDDEILAAMNRGYSVS